MWSWLKALFLRVKPDILAFLQPVLKFATTDFVAIAQAAVEVGREAGGDNSDKMKAALEYFRKNAERQGRAFIESQARTLIELALQKAKG